MLNPLLLAVLAPTRREVTRLVLFATAAVGGIVAARYLGVRKVNTAERLAETLLETERLADAARRLPEQSENALAACAAYLIGAAYSAALGVGVPGTEEDPVGHNRSLSHSYTHATANVLTEANTPDQLLTYSVAVPGVGEVRGTRRVGSLRLNGFSPTRPENDVAQITLNEEYTAQLEAEFEIPDYLITGQIRLTGVATLRDNGGNVGRLHVAHDGTVTGTITRDTRVIGRFHGDLVSGIYFSQNEIPAAPDEENAPVKEADETTPAADENTPPA